MEQLIIILKSIAVFVGFHCTIYLASFCWHKGKSYGGGNKMQVTWPTVTVNTHHHDARSPSNEQ